MQNITLINKRLIKMLWLAKMKLKHLIKEIKIQQMAILTTNTMLTTEKICRAKTTHSIREILRKLAVSKKLVWKSKFYFNKVKDWIKLSKCQLSSSDSSKNTPSDKPKSSRIPIIFNQCWVGRRPILDPQLHQTRPTWQRSMTLDPQPHNKEH